MKCISITYFNYYTTLLSADVVSIMLRKVHRVNNHGRATEAAVLFWSPF